MILKIGTYNGLTLEEVAETDPGYIFFLDKKGIVDIPEEVLEIASKNIDKSLVPDPIVLSCEEKKIMHEEAFQIKKECEKLIKKQNKLSEQINNKRIELINKCPHLEKKKEESYIEGGYFDRSQYITKLICVLCGEVLDAETKDGGFA